MEPDVYIIREVLIEKAPFIIQILARRTGWWYADRNGERFEVEVGGCNMLKKRRSGYIEHIRAGFYIVVSGKFTGMLIAKCDVIRIK